jgi:hypothetical protein
MPSCLRFVRALQWLAAGLLVLSFNASATPPGSGGSPVVYEGTLAIAIEDDFAHSRATPHYYLDEANLGRRFELQLDGRQAQGLQPGMRLRVRGSVAADHLRADTRSDSITVLTQAVTNAAVTARKALVLIVDIVDGAGTVSANSSSCDGSTALSSDIMFGSKGSVKNVDSCYQENSFGTIGWGGASYPGGAQDVVRVQISEAATPISGVCNYSAWGSAANSAAALKGVVLGNYQHKVYVLPSNVGCSWAGLAYVGCGSNCTAWIKSYSGQVCGYSDAYAHELGHNIGMWHASTDSNNDNVIDCEYCDTSDVMGYSLPNWRTSSGPHKTQMGWASGARVIDGSAGGTFTVTALESATATYPQVVKITPASGSPYYLSYRAAVGCDASMPSPTTYLNKTSIHRYSGSGNTLFIGSVGDGQSFSDAGNSLTITQIAHSPDTATFSVSMSCSAQAPSVSLSPTTQATAVLPASKGYTLTVTNRDNVSCSASNFGLSGLVPSGWGSSLSPSSLILAPGASGTASFTVSAPSGAVDGSYGVKAGTFADAQHAAAQANAIFSIDVTAPTAPSGLTAATSKGSKVALSWTASSDGSGSGVASYRIFRNGVQVATKAATTYTDAPGNGTWSYTVKAVDVAGNVSAASNSASIKVGRK